MKGLALLLALLASTASGFAPTPKILSSATAGVAAQPNALTLSSRRPESSKLFGKLWDKLNIEEDEEPMWYLINCVVGLEMDLLKQCREKCADMEDVVKFVVPTEAKTRSHGANRMVTEHKVKYLGYVFAKLRLCAETYEAVQELDLCRTWMGNTSVKNFKKLPPEPVALDEDEIEEFGLEDLEDEDEDESITAEELTGIIVDTAELDEADLEKERKEGEVMKLYLDLRVDDMIKVTAKNKFHDEDGVIKRLKDGLIKVRFFTYGTIYEEWLKPEDVRKMSDEESLRGLGGPTEPVTQSYFDEPEGEEYDGGYQSRRNAVGGLGSGGSRFTRQERIAGRFDQRGSAYDQQQNDENWNWYKDEQKEKTQGRGYADGDWGMRGSRERYGNNQAGSDGNPYPRGDRPTPRRQRKVVQRNAKENKRAGEAIDGNDWSRFISPVGGTSSKATVDDDSFFDSLMDDIAPKAQPPSPKSRQPNKRGPEQDEDAFFSSLIAEVSDVDSESDDFFAAIASEDAPSSDSLSEKSGDDLSDDFFAELGDDIASNLDDPDFASVRTDDSDDRLDFFAGLGDESPANLDSPKFGGVQTDASDEGDEFFESLAGDLLDDLSGDFVEARFDELPFGAKTNRAGREEADEDPSVKDDFFADLEAELSELDFPAADMGGEKGNEIEQGRFSGLDDDLFDSLVLEDYEHLPEELVSAGDFSEDVVDVPKPKARAKKASPAKVDSLAAAPASSSDGDLQKCTVPVLKEMLRDRGLKVSGKKAELIERLQSA